MHQVLAEALREIKLVVCDFDGVFTTGHTLIDEDGRRLYRFSIQDGMGIILLMALGVEVAVLTASESPAIRKRMEKLGIHSLEMGVHDKAVSLLKIQRALGVELEHIAYLSDDINDLPALRLVGLPVAVANARQQVKDVAKLICHAGGGEGAIREVCDAIITAKGGDFETLWEIASGRI